MKLLELFFLVVSLSTAYAYNILLIQGAPTKSHYMLVRGIADALLEAGHEITMVTPHPSKTETKNLKFVHTIEVQKFLEATEVEYKKKPEMNMSFSKILQMTRNLSNMISNNTDLREVITNTQFDAVFTDWFMSDVEAGYAAVQQVPWILFSGSSLPPALENTMDTVRSIPTVPILENGLKSMSFWERLINTLLYIVMTTMTLMNYSTVEADYKNAFGSIAKARGVPLPPFSEAIHNVSVLFVNYHPSLEPVKSLPPNVVDISGYHISKDIKPLPKDLQDLLDSSKNGVIYFSMGSSFKSALLANRTKTELLQLFGKLPYTFLWKFEETLENMPKNLHVRSWMPQASILAHPNIKAFITHGGLLSTQESLYFGVPTVAIPMFADQPINAARSEAAGHALKVDFTEDLARDLEVALGKMMSDDKYYKRAKDLSSVFRDKPVEPAKLIQHYVELAIRTKGAHHLRSKALLYRWYELWMLDQLAFFSVVLYVLYLVIKKVICFICKKIFKSTDKKVKKQ